MFIFFFSSCKKEKLKSSAFEVDRNIDCDELYENGFRRMFGVDILLIGRKRNDTIIYYEVSEKIEPIEYIPAEEVEILEKQELVSEKDIYEKYRNQDPLELTDSIYELAWENLKDQQNDICKEGKIYNRYFLDEIEQSELLVYHKKIDTSKYKILELRKIDNSNLKLEFKVLNLRKKDIFQCSTYKMDNKYYFSSTVTIREYD